MKILLTGGSGLLGQYLNIWLSEHYELVTIYNSNPGNSKLFNSIKADISDQSNLNNIIQTIKPDLIIHTAAISRPELCDKLPAEYVNEVNIKAVSTISQNCEKLKIKLIFMSTDLVYDGSRGSYLTEKAALHPLSLYAETKYKSEKVIREIFDNFIILRTALLYGMGLNHSENNFQIMLNNFKNNIPANLFYDQYRTPLSLKDAARLIKMLTEIDIKSEVINFGGLQRVSRTELAEIVCEIGKFDKSLINRISMNEVKNLHKVADVSMNTSKLNSYGLMQNSIEDSVKDILDNHF